MPFKDMHSDKMYKNFKECVKQNQWADSPEGYCAKCEKLYSGHWPSEASLSARMAASLEKSTSHSLTYNGHQIVVSRDTDEWEIIIDGKEAKRLPRSAGMNAAVEAAKKLIDKIKSCKTATSKQTAVKIIGAVPEKWETKGDQVKLSIKVIIQDNFGKEQNYNMIAWYDRKDSELKAVWGCEDILPEIERTKIAQEMKQHVFASKIEQIEQPKVLKYTVGILNATVEDFFRVDSKYGDLYPLKDGNQIVFSGLSLPEAEELSNTLQEDGYWTKIIKGIMKEDDIFKYRNR